MNSLMVEFFGQERQARQRSGVLHGLGGAGKTQIAIKFAEENRAKYVALRCVFLFSSVLMNEG